MQRSFLAILSIVVLIVFLLIIAVAGALGAAIGVAAAPTFGRSVLFVPLLGPMPVEVVGLAAGLVVGFLIATLACGAMFALIAIANNTRRTWQLLARVA